MKILSLIAVAVLCIFTNAKAQINNAVIDTVKVYGNCGMCKTKIEKAANQKNISSAEWNEETGIAVIKYDGTKTTQAEILKKIAAVGYDSDAYKAPNSIYNKLPGCCKYDRPTKNN